MSLELIFVSRKWFSGCCNFSFLRVSVHASLFFCWFR